MKGYADISLGLNGSGIWIGGEQFRNTAMQAMKTAMVSLLRMMAPNG